MTILALLAARRRWLRKPGQLVPSTPDRSDAPISTRRPRQRTRNVPHTLGAYRIPIDKMLSLRPQRVTLELVPDQGAEPRPDGL
jgi:hypothetical protein